MEHVVIIGNGISGITAARNIRKQSDARITVVSGETKYFFSRTALMYIYMGHMKFEHTQPYEDFFWEKNRIELKEGWVSSINYDEKTIQFDKGETLAYDKLILATGSKPNKFGWPGQDLPGVQGLYSKQDLDSMEEHSKGLKHAVIVGGGLIGIEMAEMLRTRNIGITFLVREPSFWNNVLPPQESAMINRHIKKHHIDLRLREELKEIIAGSDGKVSKIITGKGEEIECGLVGLTAGVSPNISFLKDAALETNRGILINQYLETNQTDVYAIGDCAEFKEALPGRRPIEQVWYTGRMMGETVAQTICGNKIKYNPGHWFNSAKFLDIEYQTYGTVLSKLQKGQSEFYWEHISENICLHIIFETESRKFIGINNFGVRLRHEAFNDYLENNRSVEYVLEHLKDANFDPEFYKSIETPIITAFNQQEGSQIQVKTKSWKRILDFVKA